MKWITGSPGKGKTIIFFENVIYHNIMKNLAAGSLSHALIHIIYGKERVPLPNFITVPGEYLKLFA